MSTAGTVGEYGGRAAGGVLGGLIGSVFGPIGTWIGRAAGSRLGGMAGRAAGEALASYMEDANAEAEEKTREAEQAKPCVDCGDIDCFKPPEGADDELKEEFRRQLKEQQDTINGMNPDDLIQNMDHYAKYGRPKTDAADRRLAREDYRTIRELELSEDYQNQGFKDYKERAIAEVAEEMRNLAATHSLDLVAGGDGSISGLGNKTINSSLGSQWKGRRAAQLKAHAQKAKEQGKKLNAKLEECPPDGKASSSPKQKSSASSTEGSQGLGDIPTS